MSVHDMQSIVNPEEFSEPVFASDETRNVLMPMGFTSDNVAERFDVT